MELRRVAEKVASRAFGKGWRRGSFVKVAAQLSADVQRHLVPLTQITKGELKEAGLGRMSFVEKRINVTASESVVIVAASLLNAVLTPDGQKESAEANYSSPPLLPPDKFGKT